VIRKKDMSQYERIYAEMTILERQIQSRAGQWELRNGKWFDIGLDAYVLRCAHCQHLFLAQRADKKTCQEKCRKSRSRKLAKANLRKGSADALRF